MPISSELTILGNLALMLVVLVLTITVVFCFRRIQVLQAKLQSQKSSLQSFHVKTGNIAEQMAPFSSAFPWNPEGFKFLGKPIDGIQFENDRVILVEIKTGKSVLSKDQRRIKNLVNNGEVYFEEIRLG
jgi:predicted Holliday junction resolvase-like endonuclease